MRVVVFPASKIVNALQEMLIQKFLAGIANMAAFSREAPQATNEPPPAKKIDSNKALYNLTLISYLLNPSDFLGRFLLIHPKQTQQKKDKNISRQPSLPRWASPQRPVCPTPSATPSETWLPSWRTSTSPSRRRRAALVGGWFGGGLVWGLRIGRDDRLDVFCWMCSRWRICDVWVT